MSADGRPGAGPEAPASPPRRVPVPPVPRGLVLFAPGTPPAVRRRRLVFAAVWVAASAALVWPVFPWAAARLPPLFGLPPSFAWVTLVLLTMFVAVAALYRADHGGIDHAGADHAGADHAGAERGHRGQQPPTAGGGD